MPRSAVKNAADRAATRRRFVRSTLLGLGLTIGVLAASLTGLVTPLERVTLDLRYRWFDRYNPPPSTRIVHVDIDDNSLRTVERWPWHRSRLAGVVDELKSAGAAVIAFDVLFDEPEERRLVERRDPFTGETRVEPGNDDAVFADAVRRAGNVLLPVDINIRPVEGDDVVERARAVIVEQPLITFDELRDRLGLAPPDAHRLREQFGTLRTSAIRRRVMLLFDSAPAEPSFADARRAILPQVPDYVQSSEGLTILRGEYDRTRALRALSPHTLPLTAAPGFVLRGRSSSIPVAPLASAAAATGFVSFKPEEDGVVRTVPPWIADERRLYPHFAIAVACMYLRVPLETVVITERQTVIPAARLGGQPPRDIRIPHLPRRPGDGWLTASDQVLVPWPQAVEDWRFLFDPARAEVRQHLPIGLLVEMHDLRRSLAINEAFAHRALVKLEQLSVTSPAMREQLEQIDGVQETIHAPTTAPADVAAAQRAYAGLRDTIVDDLSFNLDLTDAAVAASPDGKLFAQYKDAVAQVENARKQIARHEAVIRPIITDAVCIVGWTATASLADFVPTSLQSRVPGPMVHGAVLNGILTDHFIGRADLWLDLALILALGLAVTLISASFAPITGLLSTLLVSAGYFVVNGVALFDYGNIWAGAAAPIVAAVAAWTGVTVYRLVAEQRDRARITRQFKNYVSPDLVDYLVQNPELLKLEGERRELTCMFTDFEKFTTISEQLGPEKTVAVLNAYLGEATDKLMENRATVNKYIGDAIVAFWGAPIPNENHALDSCRAVLAMIDALNRLKNEPHMQEMPKLHMRIGLATGIMMVGDMGAPPRRSDYTVMGDNVNLGSRIEGVNKVFGTQVLVSSRTHELVKDVMLTRPVGRVVVVGRKGYEELHELISTRAAATEPQLQLADATAEAVDAYYHGDFQRCHDLFIALDKRFGPSKLAERYIKAANEHLAAQTPAQTFDGSFVLTEK